MKHLLLSILFFSFLSVSFAQTGASFVLTNVELDSLKKVVAQNTQYRLFYVEENKNESLRLSVSWNNINFIDQLNSAVSKVGYTLSQVGNTLYVLKGSKIATRLPDRYFSSSQGQESDSIRYATTLNSAKSIETNSANKIYFIGDPNLPFSGSRAILSGFVKQAETREPVINASVVVETTGVNVYTDIHGFYRISVPLGKTDILLKGYGVEDTPLMLDVFSDGSLDIVMKERVYSLKGAVVSAEANQQRLTTYVGIEKIPISRIRHIPVIFGEADVLKVMLTLPGVKTVGESSGGFNVRGGATDQNLILFNEGTIYNPTHLFGLFSAFNPDVVSDIELYKSSIPAKYGGRISSVLEVNSRQGKSNKITGSAGLGLLTSKLHLEGPVIKDKTNFIAGFRTTYSNWILKLLPDDSGYRNGAANFYDLTTGLSHKINNANNCYLYAYYSGDQFRFSRDTTYSYSNLNLAFKWHSIFNAKHQLTFTAGYDKYRHKVEEMANPVNAYDMRFRLEQFFVKANFDWLINDKHSLNYGLHSIYYNISPGEFLPYGPQSIVVPDVIDKERALESALFISDKWDISNQFTIDMGIRYSFYSSYASVHIYHGPEFRFSARYLLDNNTTLKAGINTMRQNIHMLSNTASASPVDIWKLSDVYIVPQTGWQVATGFYRNLFDHRYELSLEGYYKAMNHYLDYKSGAVIHMNKHIEEDVLETEGKAYGVELMLKKPFGKLNGWLAYSYSRTILREAGNKDIYEINNGNWYPAVYDKPHDIKLITNYKFTQRYSISANFDYASGRPVTIPVSVYVYAGGYRLEYSQRNQYRIPDYFRLDLAFNIEPSHNLTLWTHSVITFGVYNLTGRKNAFSVYYATGDGRKIQGYQLSIFGAPIPYINYTIKF